MNHVAMRRDKTTSIDLFRSNRRVRTDGGGTIGRLFSSQRRRLESVLRAEVVGLLVSKDVVQSL